MTVTLTEQELTELVRNIVTQVLDGTVVDPDKVCVDTIHGKLDLLSEMAYKRKDYKAKVDALSEEVIRNLCLVLYSRIIGGNPNRGHWGSELLSYLLHMARYKLKNERSWEDREDVIREVWDDNDYFEPRSIEFVIYAKFKKEGIDTDSREFIRVVHDCIDQFNVLLHLVSVGNIKDITEYVEKL